MMDGTSRPARSLICLPHMSQGLSTPPRETNLSIADSAVSKGPREHTDLRLCVCALTAIQEVMMNKQVWC